MELTEKLAALKDWLAADDFSSIKESLILKAMTLLSQKNFTLELDRQMLSTTIVVPSSLGLPLKFNLDGVLAMKLGLQVAIDAPGGEVESIIMESTKATLGLSPR